MHVFLGIFLVPAFSWWYLRVNQLPLMKNFSFTPKRLQSCCGAAHVLLKHSNTRGKLSYLLYTVVPQDMSLASIAQGDHGLWQKSSVQKQTWLHWSHWQPWLSFLCLKSRLKIFPETCPHVSWNPVTDNTVTVEMGNIWDLWTRVQFRTFICVTKLFILSP